MVLTDKDVESMICFIKGETLSEITIAMYRVVLTFRGESTLYVFLKENFFSRKDVDSDWVEVSVDSTERRSEICAFEFCSNQGRKCSSFSLNSNFFSIDFEGGGQIKLDLNYGSGEDLELQIPDKDGSNLLLFVR